MTTSSRTDDGILGDDDDILAGLLIILGGVLDTQKK